MVGDIPWIQFLYAIIATVVLFGMLFLTKAAFPRIDASIASWRDKHARKKHRVLPVHQLASVLSGLVGIIRWSIILVIVYCYLLYVFSLFETTQGISAALVTYIAAALETGWQAFIDYVPNLTTLVVIALLTYGAIKFLKPIFQELKKGTLSFPGFYQEWASPTYNLILFLIIVLAIMVAFPYLPGAGSPAFKGLSIFIGLVISLGSTGAVANIVGGVILIYTRSFKVGDVVQIGETVGEVVEKTLIVTRLKTPKQLVVTIPNSTVMAGEITNFTMTVREKDPIVLHTSITLGYDVPWRDVHKALESAAKNTKNILKDPKPFVLQKGLDDFYVQYELNAYTKHPEQMPVLYSELHQNVQDACNENGIEILSPHYSALRDGSSLAVPKKYHKKHSAPSSLHKVLK